MESRPRNPHFSRIHMINKRLPISLLAAALTWTYAATGSAAPDACEQDPGCQTHDTAGLTLVQAKRYPEALAEFQAAYRIQPIPRLLINIGRCFYRIGRHREAIGAYEQFSVADPAADPQTKERVARYVAEAQQAQQVASLPGASAPPAGDEASSPASHKTEADLARTVPPAPPREEMLPRRAARVPVTAAVLAGGGAALLLGGIGFGVSAMQTGQILVASPGPYNQPLYDLGTRLNAAAIACDIAGGAMLAAGIIWGGVAYQRQRKPSLSTQAQAAAAHGLLSPQGRF